MATRLAIIASDEVIVPLASYAESTICTEIVDELSDLFPLGVIFLAGHASNMLEFCESKLGSYPAASPQAMAYRQLKGKALTPPFVTRARSATLDIATDWLAHLDNSLIIPNLTAGLRVHLPTDFETLWFAVPEKLAGQAFIVDHIRDFLGSSAQNPIIENRIRGIINRSYFSSYARDLDAGIVSELIYLQAGYKIDTSAPSLPYKRVLREVRRYNLLSYVDQCSPDELLKLRSDPRWISAFNSAFSEPHPTDAGRSYYALGRNEMKTARVFLVHGHDEELVFKVKDYLQNGLHFPEPIVLFQQPNMGRTLIEKFEEYADSVDIAMILLTPDDIGGKVGADAQARARQNVIFELGYFVGKFGRRSGRVMLLHKGVLEIPTDLAGVVYLDVSKGVDAAGENIRKELKALGFVS